MSDVEQDDIIVYDNEPKQIAVSDTANKVNVSTNMFTYPLLQQLNNGNNYLYGRYIRKITRTYTFESTTGYIQKKLISHNNNTSNIIIFHIRGSITLTGSTVPVAYQILNEFPSHDPTSIVPCTGTTTILDCVDINTNKYRNYQLFEFLIEALDENLALINTSFTVQLSLDCFSI